MCTTALSQSVYIIRLCDMDPTSDSQKQNDSTEQSDSVSSVSSVSSDSESSEEYSPGSDDSDSGSGQSECSDVDEAAEESDGDCVELPEAESGDDQPHRKRVGRGEKNTPALKKRKGSLA